MWKAKQRRFICSLNSKFTNVTIRRLSTTTTATTTKATDAIDATAVCRRTRIRLADSLTLIHRAASTRAWPSSVCRCRLTAVLSRVGDYSSDFEMRSLVLRRKVIISKNNLQFLFFFISNATQYTLRSES